MTGLAGECLRWIDCGVSAGLTCTCVHVVGLKFNRLCRATIVAVSLAVNVLACATGQKHTACWLAGSHTPCMCAVLCSVLGLGMRLEPACLFTKTARVNSPQPFISFAAASLYPLTGSARLFSSATRTATRPASEHCKCYCFSECRLTVQQSTFKLSSERKNRPHDVTALSLRNSSYRGDPGRFGISIDDQRSLCRFSTRASQKGFPQLTWQFLTGAAKASSYLPALF